jgi:dTDP-4-dehydrorhamnose reductase
MNILVTGSCGQLGSALYRASAGSLDNYIFTGAEELDVTSLKAIRQVVEANKVRVIVNCAAFTNVVYAEEDPVTASLVNHKAVLNLATVAREVNAMLVHVSTDHVFNGDTCAPYREDAEANPLNVYGKTKLAGESSILQSGCKHIIIRTSWLYSENGNNFVKTMQRLMAARESVRVIVDQVGTPTYAGDLATLIYHVIEKNMLHKQGIYHFSNEGVCSWYDFAKAICEFSGSACDIQPYNSDEFPDKVKRPRFTALDKTKVKQAFGVQIPYWRDSLKVCIERLRVPANSALGAM